MSREVRSSLSSGLKCMAVSFNHVRRPHVLFDSPRRSRLERDAHGFVFAVVAATALTIVAAIVTLEDQDNLLG
jgi:hypothetical protein